MKHANLIEKSIILEQNTNKRKQHSDNNTKFIKEQRPKKFLTTIGKNVTQNFEEKLTNMKLYDKNINSKQQNKDKKNEMQPRKTFNHVKHTTRKRNGKQRSTSLQPALQTMYSVVKPEFAVSPISPAWQLQQQQERQGGVLNNQYLIKLNQKKLYRQLQNKYNKTLHSQFFSQANYKPLYPQRPVQNSKEITLGKIIEKDHPSQKLIQFVNYEKMMNQCRRKISPYRNIKLFKQKYTQKNQQQNPEYFAYRLKNLEGSSKTKRTIQYKQELYQQYEEISKIYKQSTMKKRSIPLPNTQYNQQKPRNKYIPIMVKGDKKIVKVIRPPIMHQSSVRERYYHQRADKLENLDYLKQQFSKQLKIDQENQKQQASAGFLFVDKLNYYSAEQKKSKKRGIFNVENLYYQAKQKKLSQKQAMNQFYKNQYYKQNLKKVRDYIIIGQKEKKMKLQTNFQRKQSVTVNKSEKEPIQQVVKQKRTIRKKRKQTGRKKLELGIFLHGNKNKEVEVKFQKYYDFLTSVTFTNSMIILPQQTKGFITFKWQIKKGNNSVVIKNCFKARWWWTKAKKGTDLQDVDLLWAPGRNKDFIVLLAVEQKNLLKLKNTQENDLSTSFISSTEDIDKENFSQQSDTTLKSYQSEQMKTYSRQKRKGIQKIKSFSTSSNRFVSKTDLKRKTESRKKLSEIMDITNELDHELQKLQWKMKYKFKYNEDKVKFVNEVKVNFPQMKIISQEKENFLKVSNRLEKNYHLSNKKALYWNLKSYCKTSQLDLYDHVPITFHIQQPGDTEYQEFVDKYNEQTRLIQVELEDSKKETGKKVKPKLKNIWIVKPGENSNRGKGITVCQTIEEVDAIINSGEVQKSGELRTFIVQKYLDRPLLYKKRKIDFRLFMLITSINGKQKGYFYKEGYIRTSSSYYNLQNLNSRYIHLTNDAIQKHGDNFGKFEQGNKVSFNGFQSYLDNTYPEKNINFYQDISPQMKNLAKHAIRAVYTKIDPQKRQHSFEVNYFPILVNIIFHQLFGLDFMIDRDFKVWLIEINTNPCLETTCPLLQRLIPRICENVFRQFFLLQYVLSFRLVVDPLFPPPIPWQTSKKFQLPDNTLEFNKFELIFDERMEGQQLRNMMEGNQTEAEKQMEFSEIEEEANESCEETN